ncbi:MAG: hypothetical protein N4A57_15735 [Anaeromicrobium sp.]|jgi:hypothetical protein|uniref:hypothetical protein n=1 Tax=Anaeromicrobium sp. TaxID=1929132 RepID=UPI0025D8CC01|nr:hypothetical protein [Anaeromicrobium sp.]MCT4595699.1 hypothetical protein [Anaeromicrobium sp.]
MKIKLFKYFSLSLIGLTCCLVGSILLDKSHNLWFVAVSSTTYHLLLLQRLANHTIVGILLAFIGFITLFYCIFMIAKILQNHWSYINSHIRYFVIVWIFLLVFTVLSNAILLHQILGYIFMFSITTFSIYLIVGYFNS